RRMGVDGPDGRPADVARAPHHCVDQSRGDHSAEFSPVRAGAGRDSFRPADRADVGSMQFVRTSYRRPTMTIDPKPRSRTVTDGISMGHDGMHFSLVSREVIADSVETVMQAERLDGSVLLAGCDKSLPGMLMAAARLDLASVFLYAGTIAPGWVKLTDGTEK